MLEFASLMVPNNPDARWAFQRLMEMVGVYKSKIFTDMSVHLMMMMLVIFDSQDREPHVRRVHRVVMDMLQRYLRMVSQQPAQDLQLVTSCMAVVPAISHQLARVFTL